MTKTVIRRYLSASPFICHGRLVFRGTRIPVATVLELLASGMSVDDILRGYPSLTKRAIQAAFDFARMKIEGEGQFIPLEKIK